MKILFFDFESFKFDWMMVAREYDTRQKHVIVNDPESLADFYEVNKESIWVGYNNRQFDQYLFKGILLGKDPFEITTKLIVDGEKGYRILPEAKGIQMYNFDLSTGFHSLKQLESFMGSRIKETSVPFDIKRKLTEQELIETEEYCTHDVDETIKVFEHKREEFDSQLSLIEAFGLPMEMFNKTKAQLAAHVLGAEMSKNRGDDFNITLPDTLQIGEKYKYIYDWYKTPSNMDYSKSLVTKVAGVEHVFAWGGIHGALPNFTHEGIILCCDVASLYPAIMIEYDFLSRNVHDKNKYKEIRDTRLVLKKKKDPRQAPYKIVLNSTFGASKADDNPLYDPLMANNVCVAGQLLLLDLIEKLEPFCRLIQSNTDGLFLIVENESEIEHIKAVAKEWETRTRLDLEWEVYSKIYQKDVNNYIIIDNKGKYKSKGAYVKKLSKTDYDLPIVNHAIVDYFVHNTPVEETIMNCDNLIEFQKTVKISSLYKYALHGNVQIKEKVLRVFASTDENAPGVFKVKTEERIEKIANSPEHCFIDNEDVTDKKVPDSLDKLYYVGVANKRIEDFLNARNKNKTSSISSGIKFVNFNSKAKLQEIYDEIEFDCFTDFLVYVTENTDIDKRSIEILIKLNYFKNYGGNVKLITVFDAFKEHYKKTHKQSTKDLRIQIVKGVENGADDQWMPVKDQMMFETEVIGAPICVFDVPKGTGYVTDVIISKFGKSSHRIQMYGLSNGNVTEMKIKQSIYDKNKIHVGDAIRIEKWERKPRFRKTDTGFETVEGKFDFWIVAYKKISLDNIRPCVI